MSELDRTIIKEKIEEVLKKTEEYGRQAEQYNLTNKELSKLIEEQVKLKDMFNDVINAYQKFIDYVDATYNEKILQNVDSTLKFVKVESEKVYSKLDDYKSYIDNKLLILYQNHDNLKEELETKYTSLSKLSLEMRNDLDGNINSLVSLNKQVKEELTMSLDNFKQDFVNIINENTSKISNDLNVVNEDVKKLLDCTAEMKCKIDKSNKINLILFLSLLCLNIIILVILFVKF